MLWATAPQLTYAPRGRPSYDGAPSRCISEQRSWTAADSSRGKPSGPLPHSARRWATSTAYSAAWRSAAFPRKIRFTSSWRGLMMGIEDITDAFIKEPAMSLILPILADSRFSARSPLRIKCSAMSSIPCPQFPRGCDRRSVTFLGSRLEECPRMPRMLWLASDGVQISRFS